MGAAAPARRVPRRTSSRKGSPEASGGQPNARVVELRRTLLLGTRAGSTEAADLSKAENPLDLMLERGWLTEDQHRAGRRYARLWLRNSRRVFRGEMPGAKVISHARSSGVKTPADYELANAIRQFNDNLIDERALRKAERAHRAAKIDWSRLPSEDVAAIFTAALDLDRASPEKRDDADAAEDRATLARIWTRLTSPQAQELFSVAVLEVWPGWVFRRAVGDLTGWQVDRQHLLLLRGLDAVAAETKRSLPACSSASAVGSAGGVGPKLIERLTYVDPDGIILFEVERRRRRGASEA